MCGSAFKNKGVQAMLDMVMEILPSPVDTDAIVGTNPKSEHEESRKPSVDEPFAALALKLPLIHMLVVCVLLVHTLVS